MGIECKIVLLFVALSIKEGILIGQDKKDATFAAFLDDGRICLTNNAAERALRGIALGRKSWLFAGSDRGGQRTASPASSLATCRIAPKSTSTDRSAWPTACSGWTGLWEAMPRRVSVGTSSLP